MATLTTRVNSMRILHLYSAFTYAQELSDLRIRWQAPTVIFCLPSLSLLRSSWLETERQKRLQRDRSCLDTSQILRPSHWWKFISTVLMFLPKRPKVFSILMSVKWYRKRLKGHKGNWERKMIIVTYNTLHGQINADTWVLYLYGSSYNSFHSSGKTFH